jgi:hypothetical protein
MLTFSIALICCSLQSPTVKKEALFAAKTCIDTQRCRNLNPLPNASNFPHKTQFCKKIPKAWWLSHYATRRKVAGSTSDEAMTALSIYLILLAALGPGLTQPLTETSTRSRKHCSLGAERARRVMLLNMCQAYRRLGPE